MARIFPATCIAGVVQVDGHTILPTPTIISQGTQSSTGVMILHGNTAYYVATNATDLADTLTQVQNVLGTVASSLNALAGGIGIPALILSTAAAATSINAVATTLGTMKVNLK